MTGLLLVMILQLLSTGTVQGYKDLCPAGCFCDHRKGETLANKQVVREAIHLKVYLCYAGWNADTLRADGG